MSVDVWRGGRLWSAARIGVPAGTAYGVIQFAFDGQAGRAALGGIFFGIFFGLWAAWYMWRRWPGAAGLGSVDRVAVVRIVRRGEHLDDPRLAAPVIDYVAVVRRARDREQWFAWVLWLFAVGTSIYAIGATIGGSARSAVVWWVLVALWVCMLASIPRKRIRALSKASHADASARQLLQRDPALRPRP